jgi:hypothetical protein
MRIIHTLLIIAAILIFCLVGAPSALQYTPDFKESLPLEGFLTLLVSIMVIGMLRTDLKVTNSPQLEKLNKFLKNPFKEYSFPAIPVHRNTLIPFIPLILVVFLLLIKPHYLFPTTGDLDYHLLRAREILENPLKGIFYDYLISYPLGRPVGHPPLFHLILASLWYVCGIRIAHIILSLTQILLSICVATCFASKKYGTIAGFFAGILVLAAPLPDTLFVIIPATYIPILAVLTIYFMGKSGKKTAIIAILGMWTHMISIVVFPLLFLVDKKGGKYLKNWKISLPLFFSVAFWLGYWIYFTGQPGPISSIHPSFISEQFINLSGTLILMSLGIPGMIILYREKKPEFKLFFIYLVTVIFLQVLINDPYRGLQYAALPLAILSGLTMQRMYNYTSKNYRKSLSILFLIILFVPVLLGASNFLISSINVSYSWDELDVPFEHRYSALGNYIQNETGQDEAIWAENSISYKIVWITGRPVSTSGTNHQKPVNAHRNMNIYECPTYFQIEDKNNISKKQIPFN